MQKLQENTMDEAEEYRQRIIDDFDQAMGGDAEEMEYQQEFETGLINDEEFPLGQLFKQAMASTDQIDDVQKKKKINIQEREEQMKLQTENFKLFEKERKAKELLANLKSAQRMIITDPMVNPGEEDIDDITKSTFFGHDQFDSAGEFNDDGKFWLSGLAGIQAMNRPLDDF